MEPGRASQIDTAPAGGQCRYTPFPGQRMGSSTLRNGLNCLDAREKAKAMRLKTAIAKAQIDEAFKFGTKTSRENGPFRDVACDGCDTVTLWLGDG